MTGDIRFSAPDESPTRGDNIPLSSNTAASPVEHRSSSEDVRTPPNLYFDVDEEKENKHTSYEELRKKHRERWTPPTMSSVTTRRMEQVSKVNNFWQNYTCKLMQMLQSDWLSHHALLAIGVDCSGMMWFSKVLKEHFETNGKSNSREYRKDIYGFLSLKTRNCSQKLLSVRIQLHMSNENSVHAIFLKREV